MTELHDHHAYRIELEFIEIEPGRFCWAFSIDGDRVTIGTHLPQPKAIARENALMIARLTVERLALQAEDRVAQLH